MVALWPAGVMKRFFDVIVASFGLAVLGLLLLIVALMIRLYDGGPALYRGVRAGRSGKPFYLLKFRTMVVDAERLGGSSTPVDDPRVTPVGRLLRRYKLDELPQLINVARGDMSLVGPRPQVPWVVELYTEQEKALLSVRPGITDYASIKFRHEGEILRGAADPDAAYFEKIAPEKTRLGLLYVGSHSLLMDVKIVLATVVALLGGDPAKLLPALRDARPIAQSKFPQVE